MLTIIHPRRILVAIVTIVIIVIIINIVINRAHVLDPAHHITLVVVTSTVQLRGFNAEIDRVG